jgi:integrase
MYSKDTQHKASKGSVQLKVSNGRLQLVFSHAGKRHYLSTGLSDSKVNRKAAEAKAKLIESDIAYERFDVTLAKYKPQKVLSSVTPVTPISTPKLSLAELWDSFVEYKRPQCSPNSMDKIYGTFTRYLHKLPTHDLTRASEIRDFAVKTFPLDSCKRFIVRLSACCDWGMKSGLISENPFKGMTSEIKLPKFHTSEDEINPFTAQERDSILEVLRSNQFCPKQSNCKHSYYFPFVKFLFSTGCRPSEAIALQWKHISSDFRFISFEQAVIVTPDGNLLREGLKTQEKRKFPCNSNLQAFLQSIKLEKVKPENLIFPGIKQGYLDFDSFRKNVWKQVLNGLELEYKKLYQTRHTFITLALENGLDAKDVARLVGNSPEVIYRHYAGNKRELFVPEF